MDDRVVACGASECGQRTPVPSWSRPPAAPTPAHRWPAEGRGGRMSCTDHAQIGEVIVGAMDVVMAMMVWLMVHFISLTEPSIWKIWMRVGGRLMKTTLMQIATTQFTQAGGG